MTRRRRSGASTSTTRRGRSSSGRTTAIIDARRWPRGCRSPTTRCLDRSARHSSANGSTTPTTTTTGPSFDILALSERLRAPVLSIVGVADNFLKSHFDLYRVTVAEPPLRTGSSSGRGSTQATSRPSRRAAPARSSSAPQGGVGVAFSTPLAARLVRPLAAGHGRRRGRRRALLAAGRGRVARRRRLAAAARRGALVSSARAAAPTVGRRRRAPRRRPAGGDEPSRHVPLRPARSRADGRRQDADADDHGGRDRIGRGRGARADVLCYTSPS